MGADGRQGGFKHELACGGEEIPPGGLRLNHGRGAKYAPWPEVSRRGRGAKPRMANYFTLSIHR